MIRSTPSRLRAVPIAVALLAGVSCWATAASAQSADAAVAALQATPPAGATIRLTDRERDAILEANTVESASAARGELPLSDSPGRRIHGEFGALVGSNGTRAIYGTAEVPLGDNADAVVSFENSRSRWGPR